MLKYFSLFICFEERFCFQSLKFQQYNSCYLSSSNASLRKRKSFRTPCDLRAFRKQTFIMPATPAGYRMMQRALKARDWDAVKELSQMYQDPFDNKYGRSPRPLNLAAKRNRVDVVEHLLNYRASPNAYPYEKKSPLQYAKGRRRRKTAAVLLARGAVNYSRKKKVKYVKRPPPYGAVPIFYVPYHGRIFRKRDLLFP